MKRSILKLFFALFSMTLLLCASFHATPVQATTKAVASKSISAQTLTTGVYLSDPVIAGERKGHQLTLALNEDGSVEMSDDAMDGKVPTVEVGEWHQSKKGNLVLNLTGTQDKKYKKPVELVFKIEDDQLVTVGFDTKLYGKSGFTLTLQDEVSKNSASTAISNTSEATSETTSEVMTETVKADASQAMTDTAEVEESDEVTETTEVGESDAMTDTTSAEESSEITDTESSSAPDVLTFVSDLLPSADTEGRQITLELSEDHSATLITDQMDGKDPLIEIGTWETNAKNDNQLDLILTGSESEEYDKPIAIVFDVDPATQTLTTAEYDKDLYGEDGFRLTLSENISTDAGSTDSQADMITGVYNSNVLPAADSPGLVMTLDLMENGNAELVSNYLNGELPIVEMGTWTDNGDETVSLVLSGTVDAGNEPGTLTEYDQPSEMTFDIYIDALVSGNLALFKLSRESLDDTNTGDTNTGDTNTGDATATDNTENEVTSVVYVSDKLSSAPTPDMQVMLELVDDGTFAMTTDYGDGKDPLFEIGDWQQDQKDESIHLTITGTEDEEYNEPIELVFEEKDNELVATQFDEEIFGKDGLTLTLQEK